MQKAYCPVGSYALSFLCIRVIRVIRAKKRIRKGISGRQEKVFPVSLNKVVTQFHLGIVDVFSYGMFLVFLADK